MASARDGGFRYLFSTESYVSEADTFKLNEEDFAKACSFLREDVIGQFTKIVTPFGKRRILYADYTASGRMLHCIQNILRAQTTYFRIEVSNLCDTNTYDALVCQARKIIKQYLNATHEYALIFTGAGSTSAVKKFVDIMEQSNWNLSSFRKRKGVDAYTEDRWGSYHCALCSLTLKTESEYRAHEHSERHKLKLGKQRHEELSERKPNQCRIKFILDPTAHHSASLPFREIVNLRHASHGFSVVTLDIDPAACIINVTQLRDELENCQGSTKDNVHTQAVVVLSAVSNVTGIALNVAVVNELVHAYGGIVCWDFAAALGHTPVDLLGNSGSRSRYNDASTDVAFFSTHKLLGGAGASGFLVIRKDLLKNEVPAVPGGGVVFYVSKDTHSYIHNTEEREEAGTPHILPDIQAGIVHQLHTFLPHDEIMKREAHFAECLREAWQQHPRICLLGPHHSGSRLSSSSQALYGLTAGSNENSIFAQTNIISLVIRYQDLQDRECGTLFLHHAFVVTLLNDLFGVQVRGGCACAGPLAQHLLGMSSEDVEQMELCLRSTGQEIFRTGFVRVSLHFTMTWQDVYVLRDAMLWVATHGWRFLPLYTPILETGEWEARGVKNIHERQRLWLGGLEFRSVSDKGEEHFMFCDSALRDDTKTEGSLEEDPRCSLTPTRLGALHRDDSSVIPHDGSTKKRSALCDPLEACVISDSLVSTNNKILHELYSGDRRHMLTVASETPAPLASGYRHLVWFALPIDAADSLLHCTDHPLQCRSKTPVTVWMRPRTYAAEPASSVSSVSSRESPVLKEQGPSLVKNLTQRNTNSGTAFGLHSTDVYSDIESDGTGSSCRTLRRPEQYLPIPRELRRQVGMAMRDFSMISKGDRVLVGLSGGKDSLTLLHILRDVQRRSPVPFTLGAATVDPQTPEYNPHPLKDYLETLNIPYYMLSYPIIELAKKHMQKQSICSFCSRIKRGMLYSCMTKNGYNVLALGQHLDDICESFVMSAFQNGVLNTMKAHYTTKENLRVCRPLVYIREKALAKFATTYRLPVITDNCPACFAAPKERHRVKLLLAQQEYQQPYIFFTLLKTLKPLIALGSPCEEAFPLRLTSEEPCSTLGSCEDNSCCNQEEEEAVEHQETRHCVTPAMKIPLRL